MASTRARAERCTAWARSRGRQCQASAIVSGVCGQHGGLSLKPPWVISDDGNGPVIWPDRGRDARRFARPVQKHAAVELIRCGVITRGLFFRWPGRFMRRIERAGIRIVQETSGLTKAVRFEVAL